MAYIGEIQLFAFGYAPPSWQLCDGSALSTTAFSSLFSLIGTTYGGDGKTAFCIPNLIGRAACSTGQGTALTERKLGDSFGAASVGLTEESTPPHTHGLGFYAVTSEVGLVNQAVDGYALAAPDASIFINVTPEVAMQSTVGLQGGAAVHENRQPFAAMTYYILATNQGGVFPTF